MRPWLFLIPLTVLTSTAISQASLAQLEQRFSRDRDQLYAEGRRPSAEQELKLTAQHTEQLKTFLEQGASGDDRWSGRMLLADLYLMQRQRDQAKEALQSIDVAEASPVLLGPEPLRCAANNRCATSSCRPPSSTQPNRRHHWPNAWRSARS